MNIMKYSSLDSYKNNNTCIYILRKKYPYNCFGMTMYMYQLLLMALVSLPSCVLENWGLKK